MAGCILPFAVYVFLMTTASNSRVKFRGKWTQMIERFFFMSSHRGVLKGLLSNGGQSEA